MSLSQSLVVFILNTGIFNTGFSNFQTQVQYETKKIFFFDQMMVVFYAMQLPVLPTFALKSKRCLIKSYCHTSFVSGVMKNKKSINNENMSLDSFFCKVHYVYSSEFVLNVDKKNWICLIRSS